MTQAALITGATGFVGSQLARRLVQMGVPVHIVVRRGSSLSILGEAAAHVQAHEHDGSTTRMIEIMGEARPEIVYHLASHIVSPHESADIEPLIRSNVLFGSQLVEAMSAHGIRFLVNTGTSWQHYEGADYRPVSLYAATKQAFEDVLRYYTDATNLCSISLHLFDTYGTGDPRPKLLHHLIKAAGTGTPLALSPGHQSLDLVHVDDVVDAFLLAADRLVGGRTGPFEVYAVSAGHTITLRELVEIFRRVSRRELIIDWGGRPYRFREVMEPWTSGAILPGWTPHVSIEEGIARLLGDR